ncbi:MAG: hypothetical protein D6722_02845 [Bacteroidetes bacterium]|nr:MAG: hypothetical protein D6722_02845 [Bacteroidota bacterium]
MKRTHLIALALGGLLLVLVIGLMQRPSGRDFATHFEEQLRYRNPNNTGPVVRVRVVTVSDTLWEEMLAYGGLQPHSKYGTTTVYFYPEGAALPAALVGREPHFDPAQSPDCLAKYQKLGQGQERFERYPFRP